MTACAEKIAYLSEHLATNAATLHGFVHPECPGIEAYACSTCSDWHIGHSERGAPCKTEKPVRPSWPKNRLYKSNHPQNPRGARTP